MRRALASLVAFFLVTGASANPLAYILSSQESAPAITDPAASDAREAVGEPEGAGALDSADLSALDGRLTMIALGYESFPAHTGVEASNLLVGYTSPRGLIPNPSDRASTLDRVYRTLALLDYTLALRYAEGESCARTPRRTLLRSQDGLFADPKTGELSEWLKLELKRGKAADAPGGLVAASARTWTPLAYLKTLADIRAESRRLADAQVLGAPRAAAYCRRGRLYEDLATAQLNSKWSDPNLSTQSLSVLLVRWGETKGVGTILKLDGKTVALVSGKLTENGYETPELTTKSGRRLSASYVRRGPIFSILSVPAADDIPALEWPAKTAGDEFTAYAVGHPIQGGPWSVTRGLARREGGVLRTDAAIDAGQAGAPLFDAEGQLAGVIAGLGTAYDAKTITAWLKDEAVPLAELPPVFDGGTGALLTTSATFAPKESGGLVETGAYFDTNPRGVCVDARGCGPAPFVSGSGGGYYNPPAGCPPTECYPLFMAPVMGLFRLIGNLLKPAPKKQVVFDDHRDSKSRTADSPRVQEIPRDPLRPNSLDLTVSRPSLALGETIEAAATLTFVGKDGSRAGHLISFTVVPGGVLDCPQTRTDASGVARTTCRTIRQPGENPFDQLQDETRRRRGLKTPGRVRRKPAAGEKNVQVKERAIDSDRALDAESDKHPEAATDTPGLEKEFPEAGPAEVVIKGDRVTLGASIDKLIATFGIDVLERPCPDDTIAQSRDGARDGISITCHPPRGSKIDIGANVHKSGASADDGDKDQPKPTIESKPDDAPTGTKPIDRTRLTHDQIHDIKNGLQAGPKDWVGISPEGDVITAGSDGHAINHGPWETFTHHRR